MKKVNVSPNRMELRKYKMKLSVALRGHKFLKDKTNQLIKEFFKVTRDAEALRNKIETELMLIYKKFAFVQMYMPKKSLGLLLALPIKSFEIECSKKTVLSSEVPKIGLTQKVVEKHIPYSPIDVPSELDDSLERINTILPDIILLAETEKSITILSLEIERSRRRVNALENILIPSYQSIISGIEFKLSENERANTTRLMKVKDLIIKSN